MTITTSAMVSIISNCTSFTLARMVLVRSVSTVTFTEAGRLACSCGSSCLMLSTTLMMFAPGCRWMFRITAGVVFIHAAWFAFSAPLHDVGHIRQPHRVAIPIGDDGIGVLLRGSAADRSRRW